MSTKRSTFLVGGVALLIAAMLAMPHIPGLPVPRLEEKRELAPQPPWVPSLAGLEAYRKGMDAYVSDNFPARPYLVEAVNYARYRLGYSGSRTVIVGKHGWLFFDDGSHLENMRPSRLASAQADAWVGKLRSRVEFLRSEGTGFVLLVPPVKERVYPELAPRWTVAAGVSDAELLASLAKASGVDNMLLPLGALRATRVNHPYIYSPFDTHWSGYGAHVGYTELLRALARSGLSEAPLGLDHFKEVDVPGPGSTSPDMAMMLGITNLVHQHYPRLASLDPNPESVERFLTKRQDGYGDRMVETSHPGKPILLLIGDSFSWQLLPFLYPHFSKIILAHTIQGFFRLDLIQTHKPDYVVLEVLERQVRDSMTGRDVVILQPDNPTDVDPSDTRATGAKASCSLDRVARLSSPTGEPVVEAVGWAADVENGRVPSALTLVLQSETSTYSAAFPAGSLRDDVGRVYRKPALRYSGFDVTAAAHALTSGHYKLYLREQLGTEARLCATSKSLDVP